MPRRNATFAYTAAIASSAITPMPPGKRSNRLAGNGLTISGQPEDQERGEGARPADRVEKQRDEHPDDLIDDDL